MSTGLKITENTLPMVAALFMLSQDDFIGKNYDALYDYFVNSGEMPYGVARAWGGDPYAWIADRLTDIYYAVEAQS